MASILLLLLLSAQAAGQQMVRVPAGPLIMGSADGDADERPPHKVQLEAFWLDRHEVTVAHYQRCIEAGVCRVPRGHDAGAVRTSKASLPVSGVTWYDARDYCRWIGKQLPTEAQWERAARGTDRRRYPWGNQLHCGRANFGNYAGAGRCAGKNPGRLLPVGSRPGGISPVGAHDMAGNVWEWVADCYRPYPGGSVTEKGGPERKVVRGGSCCSYFVMPRSANRVGYAPGLSDGDIGFRCARPVKSKSTSKGK